MPFSLEPLYATVSFVLLRWHALLTTLGLDPAGGAGWTASIVLLVVTARVLLLPVFVRQLRHQVRLRDLRPQLESLRRRHGSDRAELQRRTLELHREHGVNPLAALIPALLQIPVFLGLVHVLRHLDVLGGGVPVAHVVVVVLLALAAAVSVAGQVVARRAAGPTAADATAHRVQLATLVVVPVLALLSELVFEFSPGLALYLLTTNLWTLGQQLVTARALRRHARR